MEAIGAQNAGPKQILYENTYICNPEGYGEGYVPKQHKLKALVKEILKERMEKQQYDPIKGAQHAKHLADDLREKIKALGYMRHKLIIQVALGQRKGQAVQVVSRHLWDANVDTYASEYYENQTLYCICQVEKAAINEDTTMSCSKSTVLCISIERRENQSCRCMLCRSIEKMQLHKEPREVAVSSTEPSALAMRFGEAIGILQWQWSPLDRDPVFLERPVDHVWFITPEFLEACIRACYLLTRARSTLRFNGVTRVQCNWTS